MNAADPVAVSFRRIKKINNKQKYKVKSIICYYVTLEGHTGHPACKTIIVLILRKSSFRILGLDAPSIVFCRWGHRGSVLFLCVLFQPPSLCFGDICGGFLWGELGRVRGHPVRGP